MFIIKHTIYFIFKTTALCVFFSFAADPAPPLQNPFVGREFGALHDAAAGRALQRDEGRRLPHFAVDLS